jgi:hypothetical protein
MFEKPRTHVRVSKLIKITITITTTIITSSVSYYLRAESTARRTRTATQLCRNHNDKCDKDSSGSRAVGNLLFLSYTSKKSIREIKTKNNTKK